MLKDFKEFALRGNLLDIAVAFILAVAFGAVVLAFVDGIVMPFIAAIVGEPNFDNLTFSIGDGVIEYGRFLTALVNFLLIAFALFIVIRAIERLQKKADSPVRDCPHCLTAIPVRAAVCNACTRDVSTAL
jgi:large conductance mechanosensitive channel